MSDLTPAQWREIEKHSFICQCGNKAKVISVNGLREIIRKSKRTNDQNALLWALYDEILIRGGEALGGWTRDELHEYLLGEHFGWEIREAFGAKRQRPVRRSSRLTKAEFSDYIAFIVQRMAEHGIVLELPGDQEFTGRGVRLTEIG